jgi:glycogen phosphorylase
VVFGLCAEATSDSPVAAVAMRRGGAISGSANGHIYEGAAAAARPAEDYTVRIVPAHAGVKIPAELGLILWQK